MIEICCICNETTKNRGTFTNIGTVPETGEGSHTWIYIPKKSTAHIECYIHLCVQNGLNNGHVELVN